MAVSVTILVTGVVNPAEGAVRQVAPDETWNFANGRFYRNGQWVFLKSGKLLHDFHDASKTDQIISEIDVLINNLNYNNISINIYPNTFDSDADARVDPEKQAAYAGVGLIIDHCWERGIFCSLSFETYNVGGGGTPQALFAAHPEIQAIHALNQAAFDIEYHTLKPIPSIFHPVYLAWSRNFIRQFLAGLGHDRIARLLYVETTVEPQYLGYDRHHDPADDRRAALDYSSAAEQAFIQWNAALPPGDPRKNAMAWPTTQAQRDASIGNTVFNDFRAESLGAWVSGDIAAVRQVAPDVYIAVDYNGRFDDASEFRRVGNHLPFLAAIHGANIIQIAPHAPVWGTSCWNEVAQVNQQYGKQWAVSEHMTVAGAFSTNNSDTTSILQNTLQRGTRFGWDFVNPRNTRATDSFALYQSNWTSPVLDVIEYGNWNAWVQQIGAPPFVPGPRVPIVLTQVATDLGSFDVDYRMRHPQHSQASTTPAVIGGRDCRRNATIGLDRYFHFAMDDAFAFQTSRPKVDVRIDYFDAGSGSIALEYDSADGDIYRNGGSVALANSQTWKQHTFIITGAYFGNRQGAGADLRLAGLQGGVIYLDQVRVIAPPPGPPVIATVPAGGRRAFPQTPFSHQLVLDQGTPAPTWSVLEGPAGLQVSASGLLSGWTPVGFGEHPVVVQAVNGHGSDTESWVVRVVSKFDYDIDNDADQSDFGVFQRCLSGTAINYAPGCEDVDANADGAVDSVDLSAFLQCMNGAERIPGC